MRMTHYNPFKTLRRRCQPIHLILALTPGAFTFAVSTSLSGELDPKNGIETRNRDGRNMLRPIPATATLPTGLVRESYDNLVLPGSASFLPSCTTRPSIGRSAPFEALTRLVSRPSSCSLALHKCAKMVSRLWLEKSLPSMALQTFRIRDPQILCPRFQNDDFPFPDWGINRLIGNFTQFSLHLPWKPPKSPE